MEETTRKSESQSRNTLNLFCREIPKCIPIVESPRWGWEIFEEGATLIPRGTTLRGHRAAKGSHYGRNNAGEKPRITVVGVVAR